MTRARRIAGAVLVGALVLAGTAKAEPSTPPQPIAPPDGNGSPSIEVLYDVGSKIRYDTNPSGYGTVAFDVKRRIVLTRVTYGDFFLSGGVIHDARIETRAEAPYPVPMKDSSAYGYPRSPESEDPAGKGFVASAGIRNRLWGQDRFSLLAEGRLSYRRESYDAKATYVSYPGYAEGSPTSPDPAPAPYPGPPPEPVTLTETYQTDVQGAELSAGLVGVFTGKHYTVYGGLELLAYSDLEADATVTSSDGSRYAETSEMEQSDPVTATLGMRADFKRVWLLLETRTLGERSLRVGAGVSF